MERLRPCVVAREACGGAHHIGRHCLQHGHEPRLMSPLYVRPYVKVHKNDDRDAEAIAEAATRPTMSFVAIKSEEQLDLQALHRARERAGDREDAPDQSGPGLSDGARIRVGAGRHVFQKELMSFAAEGSPDLSHRILLMLSDMAMELATINGRVDAIHAEIKALARMDTDMQRLMEIPGVGPTIASALVAAVGTGSSFAKGRDLAAWLGLVPRQITTGSKAKLVGISKHGNRYLRKLFIHGARTVLHLVRDRTSPITRWVDSLKERAHVNVAAVAMANKMAGFPGQC
nr:IS110 family transposase [Roseovarius amoyensis]